MYDILNAFKLDLTLTHRTAVLLNNENNGTKACQAKTPPIAAKINYGKFGFQIKNSKYHTTMLLYLRVQNWLNQF